MYLTLDTKQDVKGGGQQLIFKDGSEELEVSVKSKG